MITFASWNNSEKDITKIDWLMFLAGLSAIPIWTMMDDPLLAVIIVTAIDVLAIGPTFRKSWYRPHEENSFMYGFNILRHGVSLFALQNFSWVTALFPATIMVVNIVMYTMLKWRRARLASQMASAR